MIIMKVAVICLCIFAGFCGYSGLRSKNNAFLETISPDKKYIVRLKGDPDRPGIGFENTIVFSVEKNGQEYLDNEYFHSGDAFDISFNEGYSDFAWIRNNVLRFSFGNQSVTETSTRIRLENVSNKPLSFLKLFTSDKFLAFDMDAGVFFDLLATMPKGDFVEFYIEGQFQDGQRFEGGSLFKVHTCRVYLIQVTGTKDAEFGCG